MLMTLFTTIGDAVRARNSYYNTVQELNRLSERDLKDLGISRSDIHRVAAESAFKRINGDIPQDRLQRLLVAKEA